MVIYNTGGNKLFLAYDADENTLSQAYDADGNVAWTSGQITLKVMSYNVGQWYVGGGNNVPADKDAAYYALQNGMIADANADIVCICEYWDTFSQTGRTALSLLSQYYPYIATQGGASGYLGRAICSKYPISNYTHHAYSNETSRYYDSCTVTINDVPLTVIVTHLNVKDREKRAAQVTELISFLQTQTRFIACGDYNTLDCKSTSGADYPVVIQPLKNAGFNLANCDSLGFYETYSDSPDGAYTGCLDNIVTSGNTDILTVSVDTTKLTDGIADKVDHMPLIATVVIALEE